jgi:hypothetical protein
LNHPFRFAANQTEARIVLQDGCIFLSTHVFTLSRLEIFSLNIVAFKITAIDREGLYQNWTAMLTNRTMLWPLVALCLTSSLSMAGKKT